MEDGVNDILIVFCLTVFYRYFYSSITKSFSIKSIKTFFKIDFLFLLFYFIIYYYPYQLHVLGIYNIDEDLPWYSNYVEFTNKAVILATIGLVAFMEGYNTLSTYKNLKVVSVSMKNMRSISKLFLLLIVLILIAFFVSGGTEMFIGNGFDYQLSYIFKNNYEVIGRYSLQHVSPEIHQFTPHTKQYSLGLTKYIWEHTFKIQTEVTYDILNYSNNDAVNNWYLRFQVEIGI